MKRQFITHLLFVTLLGLTTVSLISTSTVEPMHKANSINSEIPGTYFLSGIQIDMGICWLPINCESGEVIWSDTTEISYTVYIARVEGKQDTLQFYGLEGGDISVQGDNGGGSAASSDCGREDGNYPSHYCPYALLSGNELIFDLFHTGTSYTGKGTIENGIMKFETSFRYRGKRVEYIMEGQKIEYIPLLD